MKGISDEKLGAPIVFLIILAVLFVFQFLSNNFLIQSAIVVILCAGFTILRNKKEFLKSLNKKALSRIGIYFVILSFFVVYLAYMNQTPVIAVAASKHTTYQSGQTGRGCACEGFGDNDCFGSVFNNQVSAGAQYYYPIASCSNTPQAGCVQTAGYCNTAYKCSSSSGNNNYDTGGSYRCQGACDGGTACDYAVNCYNCNNDDACSGTCPDSCTYRNYGCSSGSCTYTAYDPDDSSTYCTGCGETWDANRCCGDDSSDDWKFNSDSSKACDNGVLKTCTSSGTIITLSGTGYYCDGSNWQIQKSNTAVCSNSYECQNWCVINYGGSGNICCSSSNCAYDGDCYGTGGHSEVCSADSPTYKYDECYFNAGPESYEWRDYSNACESTSADCTAASSCDGLNPGADLNRCDLTGATYLEDECSTSCQYQDVTTNVCETTETGCTGDAGADGKTPSACDGSVAYVTSTCLYQNDADDSVSACTCIESSTYWDGSKCCETGDNWVFGNDDSKACDNGVIETCSASSCTPIDLGGTNYYCNADNTWKTTKPNSCTCSTGNECTEVLCIGGQTGYCRSACSSAYSGDACSDDANNYNNDGACTAMWDEGFYVWSCDETEGSYNSTSYYHMRDCSETDDEYGCDQSLAGGYSGSGVCYDNNCQTEDYASSPFEYFDDFQVPQFGTETVVCGTENGDYCDDISDASWIPGNKRCDASDDQCRTCNFTPHTDDEGLCELGCGADSATDEKTPNACDGNNYVTSTCQYKTLTAPSGLSATVQTSKPLNSGLGKLVLSWSDNSNGESGFKVERKVDGGSYSQIGTVGAGVITYTDDNLADNTLYLYRVRAYASSPACNGAYSSSATATTSDRTGSASPSLTATADNANNEVDLSWSETDADLIVHYACEEGSGSTAEDWSSNNNDGTYYDMGWTTGETGNGQACVFDGTDDWINAGNLGDPSAGTIILWFKKANINAGSQYLLDGRGTGNWWYLQDYVSGACSDTNGNICFNSLVEITSSDLANDQWFHVAVTMDASETNIYLDGKLIDTGNGLNPDFRSVRVGTRYTGSGDFNGQMDEIKIYDEVLSQQEVIDDMQSSQVSYSLSRSGTSSGTYESISLLGSSHSYYQIISVTDNSGFGLNEFPYYFSLDTASLVGAGKMQADGDDIRIIDSSGRPVRFQLEYGTMNTAETNIWFEMSITDSSAQYYLLYGDSSMSAPAWDTAETSSRVSSVTGTTTDYTVSMVDGWTYYADDSYCRTVDVRKDGVQTGVDGHYRHTGSYPGSWWNDRVFTGALRSSGPIFVEIDYEDSAYGSYSSYGANLKYFSDGFWWANVWMTYSAETTESLYYYQHYSSDTRNSVWVNGTGALVNQDTNSGNLYEADLGQSWFGQLFSSGKYGGTRIFKGEAFNYGATSAQASYYDTHYSDSATYQIGETRNIPYIGFSGEGGIDDMEVKGARLGLLPTISLGGENSLVSDDVYSDVDATDDSAPNAATSLAGDAWSTSTWKKDSTIEVSWTDASDNGDDYYYFLNSFDSEGNDDPNFENSGFESGSGSDAYDWVEDTDCTGDLCFYRTNTGSISGYSWYAKAPAAAWNQVMYQQTSFLNSPSTVYVLEFDYNCVTATASNGYGWHMRFRDLNGGGDAKTTTGTAYLSDGTSETKSMDNFVCAVGEVGRFVGYFTTPSAAGQDQYWRVWDHTTADATQEIMFDNFRVKKVKSATVTTGLDGYATSFTTGATDITSTTKDVEDAVQAKTSGVQASGSNYYFNVKSVDNAGNWDANADTVHLGPFYVDVTVPSTPSLSVPSDGLCEANPPTLDWSDATDSHSGMGSGYYDLWVDDDSGFGTLNCDADPTSSTYSSCNSLGDYTTYYWKIRAVDSVANLGSFTGSQTFITGDAGADGKTSDACDGTIAYVTSVCVYQNSAETSQQSCGCISGAGKADSSLWDSDRCCDGTDDWVFTDNTYVCDGGNKWECHSGVVGNNRLIESQYYYCNGINADYHWLPMKEDGEPCNITDLDFGGQYYYSYECYPDLHCPIDMGVDTDGTRGLCAPDDYCATYDQIYASNNKAEIADINDTLDDYEICYEEFWYEQDTLYSGQNYCLYTYTQDGTGTNDDPVGSEDDFMCCGDDADEYFKLGINLSDSACCDWTEQCVYNHECFSGCSQNSGYICAFGSILLESDDSKGLCQNEMLNEKFNYTDLTELEQPELVGIEWLPGWTAIGDWKIHRTTNDGYLEQISTETEEHTIVYAYPVTDSIINFTSEYTGGSSGTLGVYFRYESEDNTYLLDYITTDATLELFKIENGQKTQLAQSTTSSTLDQAYDIKIELDEGNIKFYRVTSGSAFGSTLIDYTDNTFKKGKVGFRFENLKGQVDDLLIKYHGCFDDKTWDYGSYLCCGDDPVEDWCGQDFYCIDNTNYYTINDDSSERACACLSDQTPVNWFDYAYRYRINFTLTANVQTSSQRPVEFTINPKQFLGYSGSIGIPDTQNMHLFQVDNGGGFIKELPIQKASFTGGQQDDYVISRTNSDSTIQSIQLLNSTDETRTGFRPRLIGIITDKQRLYPLDDLNIMVLGRNEGDTSDDTKIYLNYTYYGSSQENHIHTTPEQKTVTSGEYFNKTYSITLPSAIDLGTFFNLTVTIEDDSGTPINVSRMTVMLPVRNTKQGITTAFNYGDKITDYPCSEQEYDPDRPLSSCTDATLEKTWYDYYESFFNISMSTGDYYTQTNHPVQVIFLQDAMNQDETKNYQLYFGKREDSRGDRTYELSSSMIYQEEFYPSTGSWEDKKSIWGNFEDLSKFITGGFSSKKGDEKYYLIDTGAPNRSIDNFERYNDEDFPKAWEIISSRYGTFGTDSDVEIITDTDKYLQITTTDAELTIAKETIASLSAYSNLTWKWKTIDMPATADESNSAYNDATRIGIEFSNGKKIWYDWTELTAKGTTFIAENEGRIILRNVDDEDTLVEENRNITQDYALFFNDKASSIKRILIKADSENTDGLITTRIGDLKLINPDEDAEGIIVKFIGNSSHPNTQSIDDDASIQEFYVNGVNLLRANDDLEGLARIYKDGSTTTIKNDWRISTVESGPVKTEFLLFSDGSTITDDCYYETRYTFYNKQNFMKVEQKLNKSCEINDDYIGAYDFLTITKRTGDKLYIDGTDKGAYTFDDTKSTDQPQNHFAYIRNDDLGIGVIGMVNDADMSDGNSYELGFDSTKFMARIDGSGTGEDNPDVSFEYYIIGLKDGQTELTTLYNELSNPPTMNIQAIEENNGPWNVGGVTNECCGDDEGEHYTKCFGYNGTNCQKTSITTQDSCCDSSTDCVFNNVCYDSALTPILDTEDDYTDQEVCYLGEWHDQDEDYAYCTTVGALWDPDYTSHGTDEYDNDLTNGMCCGDDPGEYLRTREIDSASECSQGQDPETGCANSDADDEACCESNTACVYNNECYTNSDGVITTMYNFDIICNDSDGEWEEYTT
ncbi:MAG: DUF2341 domain-containing protein [Nanoarchaeota archaeon]|nr:DUF2341 domain-containing protein [Nanoarchaeota archaeon]